MEYHFTHDFRPTDLQSKLIQFAQTRTKSDNKGNVEGAYRSNFNLGDFDTPSWNALVCGDVKSLLFNFLKTFQYPNTCVKENCFKEYVGDNLSLAPFREIIKVLFSLKSYGSPCYITVKEICLFIFDDASVACQKNPNSCEIAKKIIDFRNNIISAPSSKYYVEDPDLDFRGVKFCGTILEQLGIITIYNLPAIPVPNKTKSEYDAKWTLEPDLNSLPLDIRDNLFDILTYNGYWNYSGIVGPYRDYQQSYCDYCNRAFKKYNVITKDLQFQSNVATPEPRNMIYFGAPGTGKSWKLKYDAESFIKREGGELERVTFHPDYTYANFVGAYKPVSIGGDISYQYVPGPFLRLLVKALKSIQRNENKVYILVIEEINRANVAAVFGDVFQLLDRCDSNESEYSINTSEDMNRYLISELGVEYDCSSIKIPSNFFLWATMNSADQGVFPVDTAFKRRWNFHYIGINHNELGILNNKVSLGKDSYQKVVEWNDLRKAINQDLISYVNEDKLMGPYFLNPIDFKTNGVCDSQKFIDLFKSKVLMYLFDDAAKRKRVELFSGCSNPKLYSCICDEFDTKGINIFNSTVIGRLSF